MKYSQFLIVILAGSFFLLGCKKGFLDVDPKATQVETNYYKNADQVLSGLIAAYDPLGWEGGIGSGYANFPCLEAAADDCFGGGGSASDVPYLNTMDSYTIDAANGPHLGFWQKNFTGVSRVNTLLSVLEKEIPDLTSDLKKRYIAEAKFLRAHYYFDLVRLFGSVPLFTTPLPKEEIYNVTQVSSGDVYTQIEKDLKEAIAEVNLPDKVAVATEGGRITKGAAHALQGKVYLYQKKWKEAAAQFAEVNGVPGGTSQYGYRLIANFSDIFKVDNKFSNESIIEISHTSIAASGWGNVSDMEGMISSQMVGPRAYNGPVYYSGWGGCPITPSLYNALYGDPRYPSTIADIDSLKKLSLATYVPGYQNTGKFMKKFAPQQAFKNTSAGPAPPNYPQNYIEMRLADSYLMEAEALVQGGGDLTRAAVLLNAVRARVGLDPKAATLENIYTERRLELATEGHRWYDLVRTGRAAEILGPLGFISKKNELLPIPLPELSNTKMVQNSGYN